MYVSSSSGPSGHPGSAAASRARSPIALLTCVNCASQAPNPLTFRPSWVSAPTAGAYRWPPTAPVFTLRE
uniref:Uncharacterized protein n=1 Tax=Streptomyces sp. F11 TaxID=319318 RepID=Q58IQ1_9ACTN|nr:unknown [Streptomyces sp. F11]